jgi:response regulator RpfG family c-di-GMP phosphodiesterase
MRELVATVPRLAFARALSDVQAIVPTSARRLVGADGAALILLEGNLCVYVGEDAVAPLWKGRRFPREASAAGWVVDHRQALVIDDVYADDRVRHFVYKSTFVKSLAMVPIRTGDPIGVIGAFWSAHRHATAEELELLQALADSTAVALENVGIYTALEEARVETLQRLALACEFRDDATHVHTRRVGRIVNLLALALDLSDTEAALMSQASLLHDVGKIAIPDAILLKPGSLEPDELLEMRRHAQAGAAILAGSKSRVLMVAQEIALTHHERWDGKGYPNGLRGRQIPLSGRIVAVADIFDALTHARPYKRAWTIEAALDEITRLAGHQLDPAVVGALKSLGADTLQRVVSAQ